MKRKIAGAVLTAAMVLSMGTTVFAAELGTDAENIKIETEMSADEEMVSNGLEFVDMNSLHVDKQQVNPGDIVTISCKISGMEDVNFYYLDGNGKDVQVADTHYDAGSGTWSATFQIPSDASGVWKLDTIQMFSKTESYHVFSAETNDFGEISLAAGNFGVGGAALPQAPGVSNSNGSSAGGNGNGRTVPHYTLQDNGGDWNGTYYTMNGQVQKDVFFCDGTYTYYLQANGTPMKDRLTYHPDGEHVIYFDENGHEVFDNFQNVKRSITGEAVDDICYFDTFGHMYVDRTTYDRAGVNLYYINPYGVLQRGGWFTYPNGAVGYADENGVLR